MTNTIEIFQNNTKTINCIVSGLAITGYTPYLTVKKCKDTSVVLSKIGTVLDPSTAVFAISSTDSSITSGNYIYDITLIADNSIYTVVKDALNVLDGVKF